VTAVVGSGRDELRRAAGDCHSGLELLHIVGYFAPEPPAAYEKLGLQPTLAYFPARSAALGAASPELVVATFYVFSQRFIDLILPAAWEIVSPEQLIAARRGAIAETLHRVLGEPDVAELLELARTACAGLTPEGRPLFAAHSALPWPEEPIMALWHAASLLREYRGDGHIAMLISAGLDPVEALVLHGPFSGSTKFLQMTRGWTPEEWEAGEARLRARGLVDADAALTEEGLAFKKDVERRTVDASLKGYEQLGLEGTARLAVLLAPLRAQLLASDVFPGWVGKAKP
jgi:hypothetical protein